MKEELKSLTFKEILGYSIVAESVSRKTYLYFAESAVGELQKGRFKSLARDEVMHKKELEKIYRKEFGKGEVEYPKDKETPPHEQEIDVRTAENMVQSLEWARQNELNAYEIYKYLAEEHDMYQDMFEYLALMEWGHYESLKVEMEFYKDEMEENPEVKTMNPWDIGRQEGKL